MNTSLYTPTLRWNFPIFFKSAKSNKIKTARPFHFHRYYFFKENPVPITSTRAEVQIAIYDQFKSRHYETCRHFCKTYLQVGIVDLRSGQNELN